MLKSRTATALWLLATLLGATGVAAQTRNEVLRWEDTTNASSNVTGYRVYLGLLSGNYIQSVDAGLPTKVNGVYEFGVDVDATADVYFAVSAYNDANESTLSNEICRGPSGACGATTSEPPPEPTPSPSSPQAAVVGFVLWDAQADTVIDSQFTSGKQIQLDSQGCTAIEVVGNAYLSQSGSPGSVMFNFDGQNTTGCTDPGMSHENSAPYTWEHDNGAGQFECAVSLTLPGTHTLAVTPFDGDDCTGLAGSTVTLTFDVIAAGTQPPPPTSGTSEPLGAPGQPVLIAP